MTDAKQKVLDMVATGKVTVDEGAQLLEAIDRPGGRRRWTLAYNPFPALGVTSGLLVGGAGVLACLGVAMLGVRFDGALDLHLAPADAATAILDAANSWVTTAVLLWVAALIVARQGRLIDFLIAVGVARWPLALVGLVLGSAISDPASLADRALANPNDPLLILAALAVLPGIVWMVTLLYQGFKHASGLRGARLVITFVVGLLGAELVSKVVLALAA